MTDETPVAERGDDGDERDLLVRFVVVGVAVLAAVSAVDVLPWTLDNILAVRGGTAVRVEPALTIRLLGLSFGGMALAGAVAGVVIFRLPVLSWSTARRVALVLGLGLAIGIARTLCVALGLASALPHEYVVLETLIGTAEAAALITAALYYVGTRRRIRADERQRLEEALRAEQARRRLEQEELRVRREVSHRLHGGLQQRMVLVNRELEEIRDELVRTGDDEQARLLTELSATLDEIRESEVRAVAHELYPLAAEIDLPSALMLVVDRLPASVRMRVGYDGDVLALYTGTARSPTDRVLMYSIIEEAATNAVRHGDAHRIWVTLGAEHEPAGRPTAVVLVDDDGRGLSAGASPTLSGLAVLQARVRVRGGDLTLAAGPQGGARVAARLPLEVRDEEGRWS